MAKIHKQTNKQTKPISQIHQNNLSAQQLRNEHDFISYVKLLRLFAKRYTILIAANDTPCGFNFTPAVSSALMDIGLQVDLCQKYRHAYVAIVSAGNLLYEQLSPTVLQSVEYEGVINKLSIKIVSAGWSGNKIRSTATIMVNDENLSPNLRGLNFVIIDMMSKTVIDAVNFDTFVDNFPCRRPQEERRHLLNFQLHHPEVTMICCTDLQFPTCNLSENEKFIKQQNLSYPTILNNLDKPIFAINQYFSNSNDITEVLSVPTSYFDLHGVRQFADTRGKLVNTINGHRLTTNQPDTYIRTVYLIGGCTIFGIGSSDQGTIASHLQRLFNHEAPNQGIRVENYGYFLAELDLGTNEGLHILQSLPLKVGDVVLYFFGLTDGMQSIDISQAAQRPHKYGEIFIDNAHMTPDGNRLIADTLFLEFQKHQYYSDSTHTLPTPVPIPSVSEFVKQNVDKNNQAELVAYKHILTDFYDQMFRYRIGSLVVNCDPFTLGHRYLIERAAEQVDHLIIFVVQENQATFSFDDRISLVDQGTKDLKNVTVIPSGRFIISSLTFSEYFNKSEHQNRTIDASLDIKIFAQEIAPCLDITVRFAGDEPYDPITRQYNESMKTILPQYGIEFIEIPRLQSENGTWISASHVRQLLAIKKWDEIKKIVPMSTYHYLLQFHI